MSDLNQIITVNIDRNTTTPTATGFGTPMLVSSFPTSVFPERVQEFSTLAELVLAGFLATDPTYKMAQDLLSQNPSPVTFKVGRRGNAPQQSIELTPTDTTVGTVYTLTVTGYADAAFASRAEVIDTATYTVVGSDTPTLICDGLRTDLGTPAGDYTAAGTATLTLIADNSTMDGLLFGIQASAGLEVEDLTADPGLSADLTAIELYDPDWYAFAIDSNSHLEIDVAAAWTETLARLFVCQTQDADVVTTTDAADSTSVAAGLKLGNYDRTMLFFHRNNFDFVSTGMLGRILPELAGSSTWAYKELSSIAAQSLNTTEAGRVEDKNANFINTLAGVAVTRYGSASGAEFMDIMRGTDWLAARIQERIYALLINNDKLPYTDAGIQAVRGEILAQLDQGIARGFIAASPVPTCDVPLAVDVSSADKGTRTLNNVTFRATLAGAIHKVAIEGELNL